MGPRSATVLGDGQTVCLLSSIKPPRVVSAADSDLPTGSERRAFAPDDHRRAVAERLMKAALVVDSDPIADAEPSPRFQTS